MMQTQIEPWMLWATLALGIPSMALLIWWLWVQFRPLPRQEVRLCEHGKKPANCGKCFEEAVHRERGELWDSDLKGWRKVIGVRKDATLAFADDPPETLKDLTTKGKVDVRMGISLERHYMESHRDFHKRIYGTPLEAPLDITPGAVLRESVDLTVGSTGGLRLKPTSKFKPGQWVRIIGNGYLVQLISDRYQGGWWDARASENGVGTVHVDAIEPAIPRKGEYWAWRDSVSTNMLPVGVDWASTPYNINRITNGEASPIYFGKGNQ